MILSIFSAFATYAVLSKIWCSKKYTPLEGKMFSLQVQSWFLKLITFWKFTIGHWAARKNLQTSQID